MKNNENNFDEMQREKRGVISNQMFGLMLMALWVDICLFNFGVRWLSYPTNVMVIVLVCSIIFTVRLIADNAYVPLKTQNQKFIPRLIVIVIVTIVLSMGVSYLLMQSRGGDYVVERGDGNSALILSIVSFGGVVAAVAASLIKKWKNSKTEED